MSKKCCERKVWREGCRVGLWEYQTEEENDKVYGERMKKRRNTWNKESRKKRSIKGKTRR